MPRLFLALDLPERIRQEVAQAETALQRIFRHSKIRWVTPENLHVTLHFLGEVSEDRVDGLRTDLRQIQNPEPFDLALDKVDAFPSTKRPKIIMVETSTHPFLFVLRRRLADVIVGNGIDIDGKQFRPHITLGRVTTQSETFPEKGVPLERLKWAVTGYTLMASTLTPHGSEYSVAEHFPFT